MGASKPARGCIVVGAGPGGLQAAIYLARAMQDVLVLDRTGGRTRHAVHLENFLGHGEITGRELLDTGLRQARSFGAEYLQETVIKIERPGGFKVTTDRGVHEARFVIAASGVRDNLPEIKDLFKYYGRSVFTCVECDGYRTRGKRVLIIGNSDAALRLAFGMREMYTPDITVLTYTYDPPEPVKEELRELGIVHLRGRPESFNGSSGEVRALLLQDGRRIQCERVMIDFGFKLNDAYLSDLGLKRDARGFKYATDHRYESSLAGLFIVGPLNTGPDQAVVAAGEGATAAIEIKKRLLEL